MVATVAVIVGAGERRENRLQRFRAGGGDRFGKPGKIGDAEHADVAVAPGLRRQPIDEIANVLHFERPHELVEASGFAAAAHIEDRVNVTAAREESRVAAFHVAAHRREADRAHRRRLEIFVIGVGAEDNRETARRRPGGKCCHRAKCHPACAL